MGKARPSQTPPKSPSTAMLSRGSLFKKSDVVDDDFFSESVFKCLHSREPKMNVAEYITYRSHCYSYGPIHASFVARRCQRMFLRSDGFHSIDGCMIANAIVYDT